MELGNMIFGNSRGEYEVPRTVAYEGPWQELCEELKISFYGHAEAGCPLTEHEKGWLENETFRVMAYDWDADCDCGADDEMDKWFAAHPHKPDCYREEMERRFQATGKREERNGYWSWKEGLPYDEYRLLEDGIRKQLCAERGLTYPSGCAVHCDCNRDKLADKVWEKIGGHKPDCRNVRPNFLFKPTGFRLNWYKYPFRDSYMSENLTPAQWREMVRTCIASTRLGATV